MKNAKKVAKKVFSVLSTVLLVLSVYMALSLFITKHFSGLPSAFGFLPVTITTKSMESAGFPVGTVALVKKVSPNKLQSGDIIAFYYSQDPEVPEPQFVTSEKKPADKTKNASIFFHEIVEIETDKLGNLWFSTKGRDNLAPDIYKTYEKNVVGKYVPSFLTRVVRTRQASLTLLCVPLVVFLPYQIYLFATALMDVSLRKKGERYKNEEKNTKK